MLPTITAQNLEEGTTLQIGDVDEGDEEDAAGVEVEIEALVEGGSPLVVEYVRDGQRQSQDDDEFGVQGR